MRHQGFQDTVEDNCCAKNCEVDQDVAHTNDVNELVVAATPNDVDVDELLNEKEDGLQNGREGDPKREAELVAEFISLLFVFLHIALHCVC